MHDLLDDNESTDSPQDEYAQSEARSPISTDKKTETRHTTDLITLRNGWIGSTDRRELLVAGGLILVLDKI